MRRRGGTCPLGSPGFELAGVVVNDTVMREAITKDLMWKFLKFVRDDNVYCKYYEAFYFFSTRE